MVKLRKSSDACRESAARQREIKLSALTRRHHHANMKQKPNGLPQRYLAALEKHLKQGPQASLQPAFGLGRQAVALGLETLDLARIHEQSLVSLELSDRKNAFTKLAEKNFTATNASIEATHHAVKQTEAHLNRLQATLGRRTQELAATNRQLQRGGVQRKVMQEAAGKNGLHHKKCLEESLELQRRLRQLTHRVLVAQEADRKNISRELQDEIVQTLLGINVRLLSLKQEARISHTVLKHEITSAEKMVAKSAKSVRRVAREYSRL